MSYDKYSPREQAERISEGKDPHHHIGKKSKEVLIQEGFSIKNRHKPQTMTAIEIGDWLTDYLKWAEQVEKLNDRDFHEVMTKVNKLLRAATP